MYPYSILAASAMYHFIGSDKAMNASGKPSICFCTGSSIIVDFVL